MHRFKLNITFANTSCQIQSTLQKMGHILLDFWPLGLTNSTNFTTVAAKLGRLLSFFEVRSNVLKGEENTEKQARIQEKYQSQEVGCTKVGDNDFFGDAESL